MKIHKLRIVLYFLLIPIAGFSQNESVQFLQSITSGGSAQSDNFQITAIIGQSSPIGTAGGQNYNMVGGFMPVASSTADITAPAISHTQVASSEDSTDISIQATITDNSQLDAVNLKYREGGQTSFTTIQMTNNGDTYSGSIPASAVTSKGVEYYLSASDIYGNVSRRPASGVYSILVSVGGNGLARSSAQPSGSEQNAYRLISVPMNVSDKTPSAILADDLGKYDASKWRFFSLNSDSGYSEYPDTGPMTPGKAFWLIVKDPGKIIDIGPSTSVSTQQTYSISLNAGWTFIGDPFDFSVPQSNLSLENGDPLDIRSFTGVWQEFNGSLTPFEGYAVYSEQQTTLNVNPSMSSSTPKTLAKKESESTEVWNIPIYAHSQKIREIDTKIQLIPDASQEWDKFDKPEPPIIGKYVTVYFPHPEWKKHASNFTVDARPAPQVGESWNLMVQTNVNDKTQLTIDNLSSLPPQFEVWMVDKNLKLAQNLLEKNTYLIPKMSESSPKPLTLIIGTRDYVEKTFSDLQLVPTTFELSQNFPNPFNMETSIRYGLPEKSKVFLRVYDLRGREVKVLINGQTYDAGYHVKDWNGTNHFGQQVSSGIYFYVLQSKKGVLRKKMILLK